MHARTRVHVRVGGFAALFKFHIARTSGALVPGSYGHVSVYDSVARRILVHGGYSAVLPSHHELSDLLYSYDPKHRTWYVPIIISRVMYYGAGVVHDSLLTKLPLYKVLLIIV